MFKFFVLCTHTHPGKDIDGADLCYTDIIKFKLA